MCGRLIDVESHFCLYCGHGHPGEVRRTDLEREIATRQGPVLPVIGGILIIVSSIFIYVTIWLVLDERDTTGHDWVLSLLEDWPDWFLGILAVYGFVGIIGGMSAILRRSQSMAIAGGILSSFGIGMAIGIIGLALVAASEKEFTSVLSDSTESGKEIDSRTLEKSTFGWRP